MIHLDTHVAIWLYAKDLDRISTPARAAIEHADDLQISPMVVLEMTFLHEIGRLAVDPSGIISSLALQLNLAVSVSDFTAVIAHAAGLSWTRDPFDRIITAHAIVDHARLITADQTIRNANPVALW